MIGIKSIAMSENGKDAIAHTDDGRWLRFVNIRNEPANPEAPEIIAAAKRLGTAVQDMKVMRFDKVIDDRTGEEVKT